jgi:GNAT superfamily N-acetyltransferase
MTPHPPAADLRPTAHAALCLLEPPYQKHYRRGRFRTWNGVALVGSDLPGPGFNFAAVLAPGAPPLDDLLPVARDFFAGAGHGWGVLVEGDAGHPMEAELRARGWAVDEDEPAFVLPDLGSVSPPGSGDLVVRRLTDDAGAYHEVTAAAFRAPPEMADLLRPSQGFARDPDIGLFVGAVGGIDVAAAGYSRTGPTAVLWGVATLEEYRGRGYGSAVSRAALARAAARGCANAALRSGPKSVPVYERLGFRYVCRHRTYAAPALTGR